MKHHAKLLHSITIRPRSHGFHGITAKSGSIAMWARQTSTRVFRGPNRSLR